MVIKRNLFFCKENDENNWFWMFSLTKLMQMNQFDCVSMTFLFYLFFIYWDKSRLSKLFDLRLGNGKHMRIFLLFSFSFLYFNFLISVYINLTFVSITTIWECIYMKVMIVQLLNVCISISLCFHATIWNLIEQLTSGNFELLYWFIELIQWILDVQNYLMLMLTIFMSPFTNISRNLLGI